MIKLLTEFDGGYPDDIHYYDHDPRSPFYDDDNDEDEEYEPQGFYFIDEVVTVYCNEHDYEITNTSNTIYGPDYNDSDNIYLHTDNVRDDDEMYEELEDMLKTGKYPGVWVFEIAVEGESRDGLGLLCPSYKLFNVDTEPKRRIPDLQTLKKEFKIPSWEHTFENPEVFNV